MDIGAFELVGSLGEGGMGTVWHGRHRGAGTDVAIKVMRPEVMNQREYREAFQQEVRSVAALDHPNIVTIVDFGAIPDDVPQTDEAVVPGSPYLVMEYARGGSVVDYFHEMKWPDLRELFLVILNALAHAHARNVIHRDLKPENILVGCGPGWEVKLTDFGLAHAADRFDDTGKVETAWGTPQYMAPEQLRGFWREYGPWTDLYGLGCMAYELICRKWPYTGDTVVEIGHAHIEQPIPPLEPRVQVPRGTEEWVHKLLAKERRDRFQHAADAAYALAQLPSLEGGQRFGVLFNPPDAEREESGDGAISQVATQVVPDLESRESSTTVRYGKSGAADAFAGTDADAEWSIETPPVRLDWRRRQEGVISNELMGISLRLFGLRAIPLVNRDEERDWMWRLLRQVHQVGRARQFLVRGQAGTGKSQLLKWLSHRGQELGALHVVKAYHSPVMGPADGLEPMMERFLRCARLQGSQRRQHLRKWLNSEGLAEKVELQALLALLPGDVQERSAGEQPQLSRRERYAIIYRYLSLVARRRPVMLWLDDVQWGLDALGFAQFIERRQADDPAPLLVAMTARSETLRQRQNEAYALAALAVSEHVDDWELAPLSEEDTENLVRKLLRLNRKLAHHVLRRSEGNPLFAVQLVEDWVARGKLVMGDEGFELRRGADISIPDDLHQLWKERVDGFLQDQTADAAGSLEIAAALGQEIDNEEWTAVVAAGELKPVGDLMQRLFDEDLAHPMEEGWRFSHGMLRESLERRCREANRWKFWNRRCAETLEELYGAQEQGVGERLAWHWMEAGKPENALEPVSKSIDLAIRRSDYQHAADLLDWREMFSDDRPRWRGRNLVDRARLACWQGDYQQCVEAGEQARRYCQSKGYEDLGARAALWTGVGLRYLGRLKKARKLLELAIGQFSANDERRLARATLELGRVAESRGDFEGARSHFDRARQFFSNLGDSFGEAQAYNALGDVLRRSNRFEAAGDACHQALDRYRQLDNVWGIADCLDDLSELYRYRRELERAEELALESLRLFRSIGSGEQYFVQLNLGMVLLEDRRFDEAQTRFDDLVETFGRREQRGLEAQARAGRLAARAGLGSVEHWRREIESIESQLDGTGVGVPMIGRAMKICAELAESTGQPELSDRARQLARRQMQSVRFAQKAKSEPRQ